MPAFFSPHMRKSTLAANTRGATILEFALLLPVFMFLLMGALDIAHTIYARAILQGQVQKAGRDSGLDTNSGEASQAALDDKLRDEVHKVAPTADISFTRTAYHDYTLAQAKSEPFIDGNGNGVCDKGEAYTEINQIAGWQKDAGKDGQGGGKDAVIYTVNVQYPRLFPMVGLSGWSDKVKLTATTVLRNQPYENQADPVQGVCK